MARTLARQVAMQMLYVRMCGGATDDESFDLAFEHLELPTETETKAEPTKDDRTYIDDVLSGVQQHLAQLDDELKEHSTGDWSFDRLPYVDLSIMRLATYEILHRADVPDNVAISEAVEMAQKYSEPKNARYVNGVLGALQRDKKEG